MGPSAGPSTAGLHHRRWSPDRLLLDPYAKHVSSRKRWATRDDAEEYKPEVRQQG